VTKPTQKPKGRQAPANAVEVEVGKVMRAASG